MSHEGGILIRVVSRLQYGTDSVSGVRIYKSVIINLKTFIVTCMLTVLVVWHGIMILTNPA